MKTLIALVITLPITLATASAHASIIYMCRSYNTGYIVVADQNMQSVIFKDRFGNELDALDNVKTETRILDTLPQTTEILFTRQDELVFKILESSEEISGETKEDNSYQCFAII